MRHKPHATYFLRRSTTITGRVAFRSGLSSTTRPEYMDVAAKSTDVFHTFADSDADPNDWHKWTSHLQKAERRGLSRIAVEVFRGRLGYHALGEYGLSTTDGKGILSTGDHADYEPGAVAQKAYAVASLQHQRHADSIFRISLWYVKKKGTDPVRSDNCCALKFDGEESEGYDGMAASGMPALVYKGLIAENKDLRKFVLDLLTGQVSMSQVNTATTMNAVELMQVAMHTRRQASDEAAKIERTATPEEITKRMQVVFNGVSDTLQRLSEYLPPPGTTGSEQKTGKNGAKPGGTPNQSASQTEMADIFRSFSPEQSDKLRDKLPGDMFVDLVAILHGDPAEYQKEKATMGAILQAHRAILMQCLTPQQLMRLQAAAKL